MHSHSSIYNIVELRKYMQHNIFYSSLLVTKQTEGGIMYFSICVCHCRMFVSLYCDVGSRSVHCATTVTGSWLCHGWFCRVLNVKSDYPLCSAEGGGPAERQRIRMRLAGDRFRRKEGLRQRCAEPVAFPHSSWLAAGQDRAGPERTVDRLWRRITRGPLSSARCGTLRWTSRRCSWDALSTQPALRPCLPTRPQARTDTTNSPTTAHLMVTAVTD